MAGKREKKTNRGPKLLGALVLLGAVGALALSGPPQGAAVNSPLEQPAPETLTETTPGAREETPAPEAPAGEPESPAAPPAEEAPAEPSAPERAPELERRVMPEEPAADPAPAQTPVEDTYFDDAVFLGDSRTEGFRLYSGLKTGTYLCATGATVESVFTKSVDTPQGKMPLLDALERTDCGKIYVMLGINELGWNGTDTFRRQSAKLIERIQTDHPEAVLVLQSILPVSSRQDAKGSYVNNQRIIAYNGVLRELAEQYGAVYLNVGEAVADESGCLRADWNFDGVHLNVAGCQAWLEYLRTHPVTETPGTLPAQPDPETAAVPAEAGPEAA